MKFSAFSYSTFKWSSVLATGKQQSRRPLHPSTSLSVGQGRECTSFSQRLVAAGTNTFCRGWLQLSNASCTSADTMPDFVDTAQQQAEQGLSVLEWRWMETFELGLEECSAKEAELVAWLQHHAPHNPSNVQLGLVCLRGGLVDCPATARLHDAVYSVLGDKINSLSIHVQKPELCSAAGLLPAPSQAPHLESLSMWVSPAADRSGRVRGELTLPMLAGLRQLSTLKEIAIWCPAMEVSMDQLLSQLPCSVRSLSISLQSGQQRVFKAAAARQPTASRPPQGAAAAVRQPAPLRLLQQRAHLESLLTLDLSEEEAAEVAVGLPTPLPNLLGLTRLALKGVDLTCGRSWHWLRSLSSLQVLDLANSPIEELPVLPELRWLVLRDSAPPGSLQALPSGTSALTALTQLSLTLSGIGPGRNVSLKGLSSSLCSLAITGAGVYVLPPDLAACTALTSLHLNYLDADSAQTANHELGCLGALRSLMISHRLPRGLEQLSLLTRLELHGVDFGRPSGLEGQGCLLGRASWSLDLAPLEPELELAGLVHEACSLDLAACVWEVPMHPVGVALEAAPLPPCPAITLPALPALNSLVLRDCALPELPSQLAGALTSLSIRGGEAPAQLPPMPCLAQLALTSCTLRSVPEGLERLAALRDLDLSGNASIGRCHAALPHLPHLRRLSLADCGLEEAPPGLEGLFSLVQLELGSNVGMQVHLPRLPTLKHLSLQDCGLFQLPEGLMDLTALESLDMQGSPCCEATAEELVWLQSLFGDEVHMWGCGEGGLFGIPPCSYPDEMHL